MGKTLTNSLETYDSLTPPAPAMKVNAAAYAPTVLKTDFELFHNSPAPTQHQATEDIVSQYQQGVTAGERRAAELHASTIEAMQQSLNALQASFSDKLAALQTENAQAVTQVFEAVLPALARHSFVDDFKSILQTLVSAELSGTVSIQCADEDKPALEQLISTSPQPDLFTLTAGTAPQSQMSVRWENGGSDIDYTNTIDSARGLLAKHFGAATPTK